MPYKFTFDLSKVPLFFFTEIATVSYQKGMHKTVIKKLQEIILRFRIQEATGLNLSDAIVLLQDLIDLQAVNMIERGKFLQTKKRALFLPHCSRKYLDGRCKAVFDSNIPSYTCAHCSEDCLVNQSDRLARKKGYDVYVVPGGSCIPKILKNTQVRRRSGSCMRRRNQNVRATFEQYECGWASYTVDKEWLCKHYF